MADVVLGKFMISRLGFPRSGSRTCLNPLFTESVHEIDSSITQLQHLLSMFPRSDPRRLQYALSLGSKRIHRHTLSGQREDLDKAIVHLSELMLFLPLSLQRGPNTLRVFFVLSGALVMRSKVSRQPEDAICATTHLFYLRELPHGIPRYQVTELLVDALAMQVRMKAGNMMQNIREMAILSRELLTLDMSDVDTTRLILLLHEVVMSNIEAGIPDQPLDELIECLRMARKRRPDLLEGRIALAVSLACRYYMTNVDDDYDEVVSILDEIITHSSPGNSQDKSVALARGLATVLAAALAKVRSDAYETPEYLEEAIYRISTSSSSPFVKEDYHSVVIDPEVTAKQRFHYFGSIEGVVESSGNSPLSQPENSQTVDEMKDLLFEIRDNDDTTKIDEAIKKGRSILPPDPDGQTHASFAYLLNKAFNRTKKIEYLNEEISILRQLTETPFPQAFHFIIFPQLSQSLLARSEHFPGYRTQDLSESLEILSRYVCTARASRLDRFSYACKWANTARRYQHPTVSIAYETALSLMQDTLLFSPTLQLQHSTLVSLASAHSLPLDYASYQLELYQLGKAVETLERGRALLWSEMRHLRASIHQLRESDPDLGHKFGAVNRDLEELTKSIPPSHELNMDDGAPEDPRAVDPFGRLVLKQCGLLKERDKLISQIQALPGFATFLASPSFDKIRSSASSGPVIIINHSKWRSDILVLLHDMPPSLIPTPSDFYLRASTLKDKLLDSRRKFGLNSSDYEENLASVLKELYEVVGKPVIDRLRQLQVPEQSRIWWCPTSVLCSLPLHAMGPIPSDDGELRYFLDLYICSYTPTLSALIQSRYRDSGFRSSDKPSIQLVAQPDPSIPTVNEEIQVVQALDTEVSSLISEAATPAAAIDGFHHHRFVHIACHGTLEAGKPFEAGFELHGGARLTLLEIVRSHLPAAEFAFLSACHTAEVTEGSIMDEGLHLAAAIQYCGFRSVVGTMWAMADMDGRDLAKYFYKALFSDSSKIPYHERSAKALRFAVKKLRRKRGVTLERWVNFVHYGA
jgi:CHAT domain-containing protein